MEDRLDRPTLQEILLGKPTTAMTDTVKYLLTIPVGMWNGIPRPTKAAKDLSDVEKTLRKAGTAETSGPAKGKQKAPRAWRFGTC